MNPTFIPDYGASFSVWQLERNWQFYNEIRITSAVRTQCCYGQLEKMLGVNPRIGMKVIDGGGYENS